MGVPTQERNLTSSVTAMPGDVAMAADFSLIILSVVLPPRD